MIELNSNLQRAHFFPAQAGGRSSNAANDASCAQDKSRGNAQRITCPRPMVIRSLPYATPPPARRARI